LLIIFTCFFASAQKRKKQLPFIITINNEFPHWENITQGEFTLKDSTGNIREVMKFDYDTGIVLFKSSDYKKLLTLDKKTQLFIKFRYRGYLQEDQDGDLYEKRVPTMFINKTYNIMQIFTASNEASRATYFFKKDERYVVRFECPNFSTVMTVLKKP